MKCSDAQYLTPLYLSGELDSRSMAEFDGHLAVCAVCRASVDQQQALDKSLRNAFLCVSKDTTRLRQRVLARIEAAEGGGFIWRRSIVVRSALAMAAAVCLVAVLASAHRENSRYEEASADHVNEVVMAQPKDWHTESNGVRRYVAERIHAKNGEQPLFVPGYQLIQAKECELSRRRYVHMVYGSGVQRLSIYMPSQDEHPFLRRIATSLLPPLRSRTEAGYNVTEGDYNGHRLLLVSTLPQDQEQRIVNGLLHEMG